jgi:hypothetical protein
MLAACDNCGFDLSKTDEEFVKLFNEWLAERINACDISHFKAKFLLHLATKHLRPVAILDAWPKPPNDVQGKLNEDQMIISLGEVYKFQDIAISFASFDGIVNLFSYREPIDDPYVRIIIRQDVPLIELDRVYDAIFAFLANNKAKNSTDVNQSREEFTQMSGTRTIDDDDDRI